MQVLEIAIRDSQMTGRAAVGVVRLPLRQLSMGGQQNMWLPVQPSAAGAKVSHHGAPLSPFLGFAAVYIGPSIVFDMSCS